MNLKKLKELEAKATPRPWDGDSPSGESAAVICLHSESDEQAEGLTFLLSEERQADDVALILEMRNQLPELISWAERALPLLKLFLHFRNKLTDEKVAELEQLIKEAEGE